MTTKISSDNIQDATLATIGSGPKITQVLVCDSSYNELDDTAVDTAGGYLKIVGSGFKTGATVTINRQPATSVTFVSATELRAQVPAEAAGTYVVYVVNTDGGVALRVNGVTFSTLPSWTTDSALPTGDSGIAISIQLAAADATAYSVAGNSTLPPGLTLSSAGLLSGTITIESETLYNFVVVATDAELQDSPRSFSITITVGDPLFAQTTLILPGSATTFVQDASSNNFAVTVAGDTRPNTFNPYLTGWSNYFDGTGDYLSVASTSAFAFGTGDFTVEAWVYPTSLPDDSSAKFIIDFRPSTADQNFVMGFLGPKLYIQSTSGYILGTTTVPVNTWVHCAYVKSGNTVTVYLNGVSNGSTTMAYSQPASAATIGSAVNTTQALIGYISNLRIVKGTAIYTANFTPPTTSLTAITNTSLLTCQSNRFIDNSTNNFTITRNGDVAVRSFSPFLEPATVNGSAYFDGTGDYIKVGSTAVTLPTATTPFTMEAWVYITAFTGVSIISTNYVSGAIPFMLGLTNGTANSTTAAGGYPVMYYYTGSAWNYLVQSNATNSTQLSLNTWYHIAGVYTGSAATIYVNGTATVTAAQSTWPTTASAAGGINVGRKWDTSAGAYFSGYISNARLVIGTALYTSNFTPPTEPLTAVAGTSLLTLQNNTPVANNTFLDSSTNNLLVTRAGNATQGTFSPYSPSGWSVFFNGSTDFFKSSGGVGIGGTSFGYGTGDFTWETWVFPSSSTWTSGNFYILDHGNNGGTVSYNANRLRYYNVTVGVQDTVDTGLLPVNTWTHVAVSRISGTTRIFVNGEVRRTVASDTHSYGTSAQLWVGRYGAGGNYFPGYMSNFRIVKGVGVYSGTFTPSVTPLTAAQSAGTNIAAITNQTVLLICQDNSFANESFVPLKFDGGTTLAIGGSPRIQNFSPFRAVTQTPTSYSAYFDGTGDYLTIPATANLAVESNNFTLECWVYLPDASAAASADGPFYTSVTAAGYVAGTFWFGKHSATSGKVTVYIYNHSSSTYLMAEPTLPPADQWTHYALVKSGSTYTIYRNGVATVTATFAGAMTGATSAAWIGRAGDSAGVGLTGYISNMRLVNGTALYTANFTPSTTPLTAIANTSLLTCQSATFVDNSTNNFAITAVGNTQPTTVNPFGSTSAISTGYTAAEYSGSMYFDGTGDYLQTTLTNSALGTNNFTIEGWFYWTGGTNNNGLFQLSNTAGGFATNTAGTLCISIYFGNILLNVGSNGSSNSTGVAVPTNQWTHFAIVRSSSVSRFYLNGTLVSGFGTAGAQTDTTNYSSTFLGLGGYYSSSYLMTGYISNFRIVKGTAIYTSNFVPPLAPVEPVVNTVLLLDGTAAAITDVTTKNVLETVGAAKISTAVAKFGGSSMSFDGSGDRLIVPSSPNFDFTGNFTIEMWINFANVTSTWEAIISRAYGVAGGWRLYKGDGHNQLSWYSATTLVVLTTGSTLANNTWSHIAVVRNSGTVTIYIDGVNRGSAANTTSYTPGNYALEIGEGVVSSAYPFEGYIQDLRITKTARYTANFTPPATALQTR